MTDTETLIFFNNYYRVHVREKKDAIEKLKIFFVRQDCEREKESIKQILLW